MAIDKLGGNSFSTGAIANSLGYTPANKAGDTFTGAVTVGNTTINGTLTTNGGNTSITYNGNSSTNFPTILKSSAPDTTRAAAFAGVGQPSTWWVDTTSGQIAVGAVDGVSAASGGGLTMWVNNGVGWIQGMLLVGGTSAPGAVSLPNQPIISGQIGSALTNPAAPQKLAFDEFWVSRGITYSTSTRRFTVLVGGTYRITLNPFFASGVSACRVLIGINTDTPSASAHYGHAYRESATYDTGCLDTVVTLAAGDFVTFYLSQGTLYNQTTDRFNQFSIAKIA
jgi:hypothetical protein